MQSQSHTLDSMGRFAFEPRIVLPVSRRSVGLSSLRFTHDAAQFGFIVDRLAIQAQPRLIDT